MSVPGAVRRFANFRVFPVSGSPAAAYGGGVHRMLLLLATIGVLAAVTAPAALPSPDGPGTAAPAAKKAKKKCQRTQVRVTIGKRKRTCRPLKRFMPRPRAGDTRRIGVEGVLKLDLGRVGGRRIPTLESVLGRRRAGVARRRLLKMLPKLLRRVDRRGAGAQATASADGCRADGPGFNESTNGGSLGLSNGNGQMSADAGGGMRVQVTFPAGNCNLYDVPACPTAEGVVAGTAELPRDIHVRIWDGDELVLNQSYRTVERAKLRGQVADDAKLDHLDIDDEVVYRFSYGGSSIGRHVLLNAEIARSTQVDMRTGRYVPREANVHVLLRVNGRAPGAADELQAASDLAARFARDFAELVKTSIRIYRGNERDWNEHVNSCAKIEFSPGSGQRTLSRGERGTVKATVDAARGGSPPRARWRINAPLNAAFAPLRATPNPFSASFTVASSPSGNQVRGSFRATSRAGVAEATWTQPIRSLPNRISGSWHNVVDSEGTHTVVTFNATFVKAPSSTPSLKGEYDMTSGTGTWQTSGAEGTCNVSGSGSFSVPRGGVLLQTPGNATPGPPYSYLMQTAAPQETTTLNYSGCDDPADDGPRTVPIPFSGLNISGTTPDGFVYEGSKTETSGPDYTNQEDWSFTGTL
jgi:hypothetical protein